MSPDFLSDTRLIIENLLVGSAIVFKNTGSARSAFVFYDAIRISVAERSESPAFVIAK